MEGFCNLGNRDPLDYDLYIFDMGNVVVKNISVIQGIADHYHLPFDEFSADYRKYEFPLMDGVVSSSSYWRHVGKLFGIRVAGDPLADFFQPKGNAEVIALIERLRTVGKTVVCGSNTYAAHWGYMKDHGFLTMFDRFYASHEMGITKPCRQFFQHIMKQESVAADRVFFVDDYQENIVAARALGITALRYANDAQSTADEKLKTVFSCFFTQS